MNSPPRNAKAARVAPAASQSRDNDTAKPATPAEPGQISRRPDRYRVQVADAWDVPGADAFRILDRAWRLRRRR